jgi:hypothetical protein
LKFTICRGLKEIERFLPLGEWDRVFLSAEDATICQHPLFVLSWYRTFCKLRGNQPVLIYGEDHQREILFPLEGTKAGWGSLWRNQLVGLGGAYNIDFQDPLVSGPLWTSEECRLFWIHLFRYLRNAAPEYNQVLLYRLRADYVHQSCNPSVTNVAPYLDLRGLYSFTELLQRCNRNHRGDVQRQIRRLREKGEIFLKVFTPNEQDEALVELTRFFVAYDRQWAPHGPHMFQTASGRLFLEQILLHFLPTTWLHFSVLRCGIHSIHWHIGFLFKGRLYWYKLAYDHSWKTYSPGKVHLALLIEACIKDSIPFFDFLYGGEAYKYSWKPLDIPLLGISAWNGSQPLFRLWEGICKPALRLARNFLRRSDSQ